MMRPLLFVLFFTSLSTQAQAAMPERVIIHYKNSQVRAGAMVTGLAKARVQETRSLKKGEQIDQVMNDLRENPDIESVEPDLLLHPQFVETINDPNYGTQWNLRDANFPEAWESTTGSNSIVIAVLDTGVLPHPDLAVKLLPGYDLISDPVIANDGNGRDDNAVDPGDWVAVGDPCYDGWPQNSTWHGTHVAGIAAASTQNAVGIAGGDWSARILPVRVLGKCGGFTSDIADGIRWAVGASVPGIPVNPNPAKVVNLSLGGFGQCGQAMQSAINEANARGAVVVVAAGNANANLDFQSVTPANCEGVITVGAGNSRGTRAGYSNFGERVDLLAPGGDFNGSILSTHNLGKTVAGNHHYQFLDGTSMATPHVSAAVSLIFSINPNLPSLQVIDILKRSTRSFSSESFCHTDTCGEGLLDVGAAVRIAMNESPDGRFNPSPVTSGVNDLNTRVEVNEKSSGGCGTIDLSQNGGGGGKGGPLLLSLAFILIALESMKRRPSFQAARY